MIRPRIARPSIGFYLVALVMLAVIPLMLIAGLLIWRQSVVQRQVFDRSLLQTAQALSVAVDRQLSADRVMLETLAQSQLIDSGDMAAFHALCANVIRQRQGLFISLFDEEGKQLFNTLRPAGSPLPTPFVNALPPDPERPQVGDTRSLQEVLKTGAAVNSDLFFGLVAGRLIFTMNVPVIREGKIRYVLNAGFDPTVMTDLLHESAQFRGVPAVILDRKGFIVGRAKDADKFVGHLAPAHLREQLKISDAGVAAGDTLAGVPLYYSYSRSPISGWTASMGANRAQLERDVRDGWILGGALAFGGLLLGALAALAIAARLRRSIVALATAASRKERPPPVGLRTREIEHLERAVSAAAQTREAQARKEEAEAASRSKDRYIATLSHELRNPLAALTNAVHILKMEGDNASLDMMQRQIAQLTRMVNDLLDVSRVTHGKIALEVAPVDLSKVVCDAIETMQPALQQKRMDVSRNLPGEPVMVRGDAARLSQVFCNLLENAAKFSAEGGALSVALVRQEADAVVTFADRGVGIDPAFLPRMFEAFTQADTSLERATSGLGLGLALARQIVEAHGGRIEAASAGLGQGSVFTVKLPLA